MSDIDDLAEKVQVIEAIVEHWFFDLFHGSVVARSTDVWNHVHGAKDELKRRIASFLAEASQD